MRRVSTWPLRRCTPVEGALLAPLPPRGPRHSPVIWVGSLAVSVTGGGPRRAPDRAPLPTSGWQGGDLVRRLLARPLPPSSPGCGTNPDADVNFADNPRGYTEGSQNHTRWPTAWTVTMLDFFRQHRGPRR